MAYDPIKRLRLDHHNIDLEKSYEIFDSIQNNLIIYLYLLKDKNIFCTTLESLQCMIRDSTIVLTRGQYTCTDCNHTFKQSNPIMREVKTISIQKDFCILESLRDKNKTYSSVAKEYDVSVTYGHNLFDKKVSLKRLSLPTSFMY